jgi:hypothetical protein
MFEWLAPEFRALHPLGGDLSAGMQRNHRACLSQPALRYELSRAGLPALARQRCGKASAGVSVPPPVPAPSAVPGRAGCARWVLKCPEHVFALRAIRTVYPDARLIFVHRDPVKVLLSVAHLTEVLRRPFTRQLDPKLDRPRRKCALAGGRRTDDGSRRRRRPAGARLPRSPHGSDQRSGRTVDGVYRHFGMTLPDHCRRHLDRTLCHRTAKWRLWSPTLRIRGSWPGRGVERERFRPYMLRFGIAAELARHGRTGPQGSRYDAGLIGSAQALHCTALRMNIGAWSGCVVTTAVGKTGRCRSMRCETAG